MQTQIHAFDPDTRTVKVTFTAGEIVHERGVNACLTQGGGYDEEATARRVADVARGVAVKIEAGAITNPVPIELPEPVETPAEEPAAE